MTYEGGIPDFAMVPAKESGERVIIPINKGAVYSPVQVTNITEKPKMTITIEEDILVPDTKPDLREILLIDGKAHLAGREIDRISKGEDYINLAGEVELQTLYLPEKNDMGGPIIAVQSRVAFKDQWHTALSQGATMVMDCRTEKIDYMVINERKYRVKIQVAIYAKEYDDRKIDIFEGINGEEIQMLKEKVEITNVALRKKDVMSIKEDLVLKDEVEIDNILKQDISVMESYKQITAEKIVVSGFVLVNLLYSSGGCERTKGSAACQGGDSIKQLQEKVEFTQFIPLSQTQPTAAWSGSAVDFDGSALKVKQVQDELAGSVLRLEGDITTYVELYQTKEKQIIVDGYHRTKDFVCDFKEEPGKTLVGTAMGEASVREILSPESAAGDMDRIIYTTGEILRAESRAEQGKVITEGSILAKLVCLCGGSEGEAWDLLQKRSAIHDASGEYVFAEESGEEDGFGAKYFSVKEEVPFRVVSSAPPMNGGETVNHRISLKDFWAEKINGKQVEFNATVFVTCDIMRKNQFKVLVNPAFEEGGLHKSIAPMVVYVAKEGDSLWSISKQFKTTADTISQINDFSGAEGDKIPAGKKLLIIK